MYYKATFTNNRDGERQKDALVHALQSFLFKNTVISFAADFVVYVTVPRRGQRRFIHRNHERLTRWGMAFIDAAESQAKAA